MCLATPVQIKKILGNKAIVDSLGNDKEIDLSLVKNAKEEDWLLCHDGLAINIISEAEAQKILELVNACPHHR